MFLTYFEFYISKQVKELDLLYCSEIKESDFILLEAAKIRIAHGNLTLSTINKLLKVCDFYQIVIFKLISAED